MHCLDIVRKITRLLQILILEQIQNEAERKKIGEQKISWQKIDSRKKPHTEKFIYNESEI